MGPIQAGNDLNNFNNFNKMKTTDTFKKTIQAYLERRSSEDSLFAVSFAKENKNIDACITYILNSVKNSGCSGFADDEIYSMAVHYYDEDDVQIGKEINCKVVVNHNSVVLSEEEKAQAKKEAIERAISDERERIMKKPDPKKVQEREKIMQQPTLF